MIKTATRLIKETFGKSQDYYFESRPTINRYALHPGKIQSSSDGDTHFISASQLARLYRVRMSECVIWKEGMHTHDYIHLFPRTNGNYQLPEKAGWDS
jgi:hypothetical protein